MGVIKITWLLYLPVDTVLRHTGLIILDKPFLLIDKRFILYNEHSRVKFIKKKYEN